jgi:hypothetical protein
MGFTSSMNGNCNEFFSFFSTLKINNIILMFDVYNFMRFFMKLMLHNPKKKNYYNNIYLHMATTHRWICVFDEGINEKTNMNETQIYEWNQKLDFPEKFDDLIHFLDTWIKVRRFVKKHEKTFRVSLQMCAYCE